MRLRGKLDSPEAASIKVRYGGQIEVPYGG